MRENGKLDYLELPVVDGDIHSVKDFYQNAFNWQFTDYGPNYSAFSEGLDGGFDAHPSKNKPKPLPVLYSDNLQATLKAVTDAGGTITRPIYAFPGGSRFHFTDPSGNELAVWSEK